eukprot:g21402.t1
MAGAPSCATEKRPTIVITMIVHCKKQPPPPAEVRFRKCARCLYVLRPGVPEGTLEERARPALTVLVRSQPRAPLSSLLALLNAVNIGCGRGGKFGVCTMGSPLRKPNVGSIGFAQWATGASGSVRGEDEELLSFMSGLFLARTRPSLPICRQDGCCAQALDDNLYCVIHEPGWLDKA